MVGNKPQRCYGIELIVMVQLTGGTLQAEVAMSY